MAAPPSAHPLGERGDRWSPCSLPARGQASMAIAQLSPREAKVLTGRSRLDYVGYAALAAIVAAWSFRAFHDPSAYDTGAAWAAGRIAWVTGHPETLPTWTGLPF